MAALAAGLVATSPAQAQSAPRSAPEEVGLGDIVVTARKVSENMQSVPVAITVQTGEQLVQQGARTAIDIARFTPGLFMREGSATPSSLTISLRGQVQTDVLITLDPSVGTYVDDVYWARAYGLNADLLDIANVQVLKGPQGTLFGRNTTGGAILFKTKDPNLTDFGGKVSLTYGRFDQKIGEVILNAPLVTDKLGVRLAGRVSKRDGWIKSFAFPGAPTDTSGRRYGAIDDVAFRAKVLARPTDTLSLLVSADYWKTDADSIARRLGYAPPGDIRSLPAMTPEVAALVPGAVAAGCTTCVTNYIGTYGSNFGAAVAGGDPTAALATNPALTSAYNRGILDLGTQRLRDLVTAQNARPFSAANDGTDHVRTETKTISGTAALDTTFGQLKAVVAWRQIASDTIYDLDGTPFPIHVTSGIQKVTQYSGELQATGKTVGGFMNFAVGAFYFHESGFDGSISPRGPLSYVDSAGKLVNFAAASTAVASAYGEIDNDSIGAYGQFDFNLSDRFSITAGLRYSVDDKHLVNRSGNLDLVAAGFVQTNAQGIAISQNYAGVDVQNFGRLFIGPNAAYTLNTNGTPQCSFLAAGCALVSRASFSGLSYTFGANYKITDDVMVYAKHSKGFRSGGHNLRATALAQAIPFQPEIAYTNEIGVKSQFFDNRVRFNAAAYRTRVNNMQRSTLFLVNGSPITFLSNAASARILGLEAELTLAPVEGLLLTGTVALTDPKYLNFSELPSRTNLGGDRTSDLFESIPKKTFSLQGSYTFNLGGESSVTLAANYNWQSKVKLLSNNFSIGNPYLVITDPFTGKTIAQSFIDLGSMDPVGILGGSITFSLKDRYKLMVWGRNLTNEQGNTIATNASLGYMGNGMREPRTYGLTLSAEF
jgi:iron complex outermembrane receptor protein